MRSAAAVALVLLASCAVDTGDEISPDDGYDDTVDDGKADDAGASAPLVHAFKDHDLYPEGGALDPVEHAFYVGSLRHGNITRISADGTESVFNAGTGEADRYTLGMQVDAARHRLWVCTTQSSLGRIWLFDLTSGARTADI